MQRVVVILQQLQGFWGYACSERQYFCRKDHAFRIYNFSLCPDNFGLRVSPTRSSKVKEGKGRC
jgi:hypothetical protein